MRTRWKRRTRNRPFHVACRRTVQTSRRDVVPRPVIAPGHRARPHMGGPPLFNLTPHTQGPTPCATTASAPC